MPPKTKKVIKKKVNRNIALPSTPDELEQVLVGFLTPDTDVTSKSLEILRAFLELPQCVPALFNRMCSSPVATSRQLAAVLLYKRIKKHWRHVPEAGKKACRESILQRLIVESSLDVRRSITALACILARVELPKGNWPNLLTWVWEACNSDSVDHRETCLRILRSLIEYCPETMEPHFKQLRALFEAFVLDGNKQIRLRAITGLNTLFENYTEEEDMMSTVDLLPKLLQVTQLCINSDDDECLDALINMFSGLCDLPTFDNCIPQLFQMLLQIFTNEENLVTLRGQASSLISEYCKIRPGSFSKHNLTDSCVDSIFKTIIEPDETVFDNSESTAQHLAVEMLEAFLQFLPRQVVVGKCVHFIQNSIVHADAEYRKAAFVIAAIVAESAGDLLVEIEEGKVLNAIIEQVINVIGQESNGMVVMSMIIAIIHIMETYGEDIGDYYARILPIFCQMLEQPYPDNISRKLLVGVDVCCEQMGSRVVPYIQPVMSLLDRKLQSDDLETKETAVNAIASIALSSTDNFLPYFNAVLTCISGFLNLPNDVTINELKSKSISCIGSMARAVGKSNWSDTINNITKNVITLYECEECNYQEAVISYLGDIVQSLGSEVPSDLVKLTFDFCCDSIDSVEGLHSQEDDEMGSNIAGFSDDEGEENNAYAAELAKLTPEERAILEEENEDFENHTKSMTMDVGALDAKLAAFNTLSNMIMTLKGDFIPYIEDLKRLLSGSINFPLDEIRKASVIIYGTLLEMLVGLYPNPNGIVQGVASPVHANVKDLLDHVVSQYMEILDFEDEPVVVTATLTQFEYLFLRFGMDILSFEDVGTRFSESISRFVKEEGVCQVSDEDNDIQSESNMEVLDALCDLLSAMAKAMGNVFNPFFKTSLHYLLKYCSKDRPDSFRALSIGMIAEVIDHLGVSGVEYSNELFPIAVEYMDDHSVEVRRHATYLAGTVAMSAPKQLATALLPLACEKLSKLVFPKSELAQHNRYLIGCHDNAVACYAKFVQSNPESVPVDQLIPMIVESMPLLEDAIEGSRMYPYICEWFSLYPQIMIPLIPKVATAFAQVWSEALVTETAYDIMATWMKQVIAQYPNDMQALMNSFPVEYQEAVKKALA